MDFKEEGYVKFGIFRKLVGLLLAFAVSNYLRVFLCGNLFF